MTITLPDLSKISRETVIWIAVVIAAGFGGYQLGKHGLPFDPGTPVVVPEVSKAAIVIQHESDQGSLPPYVTGAVESLRAAGRTVYVIDDDVTTGLGTPPKPVAPAIEPGRKIMGGSEGKGQALVLLSGDMVLKAIELPKSKESIVEACQ